MENPSGYHSGINDSLSEYSKQKMSHGLENKKVGQGDRLTEIASGPKTE
jgi:hypothetical protein